MAEGAVLGTAIVNLVFNKGNMASDLSGIAKSTNTSIGSIIKTVSRLGGVGVGLYGLKQAVMTVHKAFVDFDRDMHNIWTLTDQTKEEIVELSNELRNLAWEYNVTSSEAAKAMYQIYSATFYGADAMKILESSARGAAAGLTDVFTAANMGTTVLNAYGMEAKEIAHVNDLLFTAIRYGKTTYGELASQFGRLAGVAAPVGASIEEMAAAIATLTRQGIATDWAVTSLRQTLMKMLQPTKDLEKAIEDLGYSSGGAMIKAIGFANSIKQVTDWAAANGVEISKMFTNVRAVTAVLPLATTAAAGFAKDLQRMADAGGAADDAFFKQIGSWAYQLEILKTRMNDIGITLGKLVTPAITGFLEAILMLLRPIALVAEGLEAIGGPILLRYATYLATFTAGIWALNRALRSLIATKAVAFLTGLGGAAASSAIAVGAMAPWATTSTAVAGAAAASGAAVGAGAAAGALGMGALGLGALSWGIKGIVDLNVELGEVTGAEETAKAIGNSLVDSLGTVIGGALLGKVLFGAAASGAWIGAAAAATAIATIYVYHIVKKEAETHAERVSVARETMGAWGGLPTEMKASTSAEEMLSALSKLNSEIEDTPEYLEAVVDAIKLMYDYVPPTPSTYSPYTGKATEGESASYELQGPYRGVSTLASMTGIEFPVDQVEAAAALWKRALVDATIGSFADLTAVARRFLPEEMQDYIDEMDEIAGEALQKGHWSIFGEDIIAIINEWGKSVNDAMNEEIKNIDLSGLVSTMEASIAAFGAIPGEEPLPEAGEKAMNDWLAAGKAAAIQSADAQAQFDELTKDMSDDERIATFFKIIPMLAGDAAQNLAYLSELMVLTSQEMIDRVMEIINEGLAEPLPEIVLPTTQEQIDAARVAFDELFEVFQTGGGLIGDSTARLADLRVMANEWSDNAEAAGISGSSFALAIKALAKYMEDATSSADDFSEKILNLTLKMAGDAAKLIGPEATSIVGSITKVVQTGVAWTTATANPVVGAIAAGVQAIIEVIGFGQSMKAKREAEAAAAVEELRQNVLSLAESATAASDALWGLVQQAESVQRLQSAWMTLQEKLISALFGFLWPIVGILEMITGSLEDSTDAIEEETEARRASLNVPTGYKVRRTEWRAATPGQPGDLIEDDSSVTDDIEETLTWWQQMVLEFGSVLEDVIAPFRNFITTLDAAWQAIGPSIIQGVIPVLETFGWALDQLGTWITDVFVDDMKRFFEGFGEWWTSDVDPFMKEDVFPKLGEWMEAIYEWIRDDFLPFLKGTVWPFFKTELWPIIVEGIEALGGALKEVWDYIVLHWPEIKEIIKDGLITWFKNLVDKVKNVVPWIESLGTAAGKVSGFFDQLGRSLGAAMDLILYPLELLGWAIKNVFIAINNAWEWFTHILNPSSSGNQIPYESVPHLATGGKLLTDGLVFGHKNEIVMPASVTPLSAGMGTGGAIEVIVHHTTTLDGRVLTKEITREKRFQEKIMTGSPNGRRWEAVGA